MKNLFKIISTPLLDTSTLHCRAPLVECCRYISKKAPAKEGKTRMMRRDQTDKHTEVIEVDKSDKHRYFKWKYQPLPTQTSEDQVNPHFNIRSPEFKLPNPRGRLARSAWRQRIAEVQAARNDPELEKLSRHRKLFLSLDEIEAGWKTEFGLHDINKLIRFNQISRDLFHSDDVIMKTWIDVAFTDVKIHRGNLVQPSQLLSSPSCISFTPEEGQLYTLIMSNLDGHPQGTGNEVLHWMVCNISNGDVQNSDIILNYLPPLPWQGTGYHRLTFTLYHQTEGRVQSKPISGQDLLRNRCMTSRHFASANQLSPVGITWCQVTWDESVSKTCKQLQDLSDEPVFDMEEYLEPKAEQKMLVRQLSELKYRNM